MTIRDGRHYRPSAHFHQDMCGASWYSFMCLTHSGLRGSVGWDRFHRLLCDTGEATRLAGSMIVRLEFAAANSMRRKPWGKEGNHRILLAAAEDLFKAHSWDSELFFLFYEEICDNIGEGLLFRGTSDHLKHVWQIAKTRLTEATASSESKNSRWWSIEEQGRTQKPMRGMNCMLLTFIGKRRGWYPTFSSIPLLGDREADLKETANPAPRVWKVSKKLMNQPLAEARQAKMGKSM